jgi:polynucleotide 5'-kinase involved in rRNA processing
MLTRAQRQRQLKAIEHGERNQDRLEKSVAKSKLRGKRTQSRAQTWEEINAEKAAKIAKVMAEGTGADMGGAESEEDEEEETMGEDAGDAMKDLDQQPALPEQNLGQASSVAQEPTPVLQQASVAVEDIDDDIL